MSCKSRMQMKKRLEGFKLKRERERERERDKKYKTDNQEKTRKRETDLTDHFYCL